MSGKSMHPMPLAAPLDLRQKIQDDDYAFPYHYVPQMTPGYSHTYSWPWGLYYISAMEYVLDRVHTLRPAAVADIGTGDGRLVRELALKLPDARVVGIDYSMRAIQLARALNPTLDFRCADILNDPVDKTFDVLTLVEVFEHIPPELGMGFVSALRRLIRDNGTLIVTVPHSNMKVGKKHFRHFSAETLRAAFDEHFEVQECVFLDNRSRAVGWIRALLENRYFILTHWGIRNRLYRLYKRAFLISEEARCGRIFMRLRPRIPGELPST